MWESSTYRQIVEVGRRLGRKQALNEGFLTGVRESILLMLTKRLGETPFAIRRTIARIRDRDDLERLLIHASSAANWDEITEMAASSKTAFEVEIPNPDVAHHADQFADAAVILYQSLESAQCVPSVLLEGALALELYLKSLNSKTLAHEIDGVPGFLLTSTPAQREHKLDQLFDALDGSIQGELQHAYAAQQIVPGTLLLRDALARYRTMFIDIRYVFERPEWGGYSITDLIRLVKFFRKHVASMPRRVLDAS